MTGKVARLIFAVVLAVTVTIPLATPALAQTITLRGASQFDDTHPFNQGMLKFEELVKKLDMRKELVQRSVVNALNRTGSSVMDALTAEMSTAFDRPTPYTLGSLRVDKATASNMLARIAPKDFAGKGTPGASVTDRRQQITDDKFARAARRAQAREAAM